MKHILKFNENLNTTNDLNLDTDETFKIIIDKIINIIDTDHYTNGEKLTEIGQLTTKLNISKTYYEKIIKYFEKNDSFYLRWVLPILDDYIREEEEKQIDINISRWFNSINVYNKSLALKKLDELGYKIIKK
jgi:hypothetical protein